ncbi:MAG TPA: nucleotidyltransferase domain-containing protein [Chitinophagaceae bacterium]|nr:nucleotidyltransferase domain-containing protein [Chitinophagaceae bacterium]
MNHDLEILKEIKKTVHSYLPDAEIILFGSRASGNVHDESDWDILILSDNPVDIHLKRKIRKKIYPLSWKYSTFIQTVIAEKKEWQTNPGYYALRKNISENPILAL